MGRISIRIVCWRRAYSRAFICMHGDLAFEEHRWFLVLGYTGTGEAQADWGLRIRIGH